MQSSILTDLDALNNMAVLLLNKDPIFSSALAIFILTTFSFESSNFELNKKTLSNLSQASSIIFSLLAESLYLAL